MSGGMERDKAESLSAKETEEREEMKRELLDLKMYEADYTYKDMKQILRFIKESEDMANKANGDKNVQKELSHVSNDCRQESMPRTNLAQESEMQEHNNDASQSIHTCRSNIVCSRPDLAPSVSGSRNTTYRGKNVDSEELFVKSQDNSNMRDSYSHSTSRYISLKSENSLQDSDITNSTETNMDTISECNQKLDRWQINPLAACVSENDVPLKELNRPVVEDRMPFKLCNGAQTPEMLEKLLPALNLHLKQTAELWHSGRCTANNKIQWGSPIQVGCPKNNSDMSLTNTKSAHNEMECTRKYYNERPSKRKSASILSSPDLTYSSSDEDENIVKRKKMQSHEDESRVLCSPKDISTAAFSEMDRNFNVNRDDVGKLFDDAEIGDSVMECKMEADESISNKSHSVSRRNIASPVVKKNVNGRNEHFDVSLESPMAHNSKDKPNPVAYRDKNNDLTDEESFIELENDNASNVKAPSENIVIKPLPVKGLSHRIKNACMVLERIQLEKYKKKISEKDETQRKENEERKTREDFYKRQIGERQKREKLKEEKEKYKEEQSKKWKHVVDMKYKKKMNKEKLQELIGENENRSIEIIDESRSFQENNTPVARHSGIASNNVNCPICNKPFPSDVIENHAAECDQYMSENEHDNELYSFENRSPTNIKNTEILECGICSKYRTTNGIDYEEHVNNCLQKQHQRESLNEYQNNESDNILSSPIRCFRPISEQTDSNIDYRRQFPSNSKTQVRSNRKRKR